MTTTQSIEPELWLNRLWGINLIHWKSTCEFNWKWYWWTPNPHHPTWLGILERTQDKTSVFRKAKLTMKYSKIFPSETTKTVLTQGDELLQFSFVIRFENCGLSLHDWTLVHVGPSQNIPMRYATVCGRYVTKYERAESFCMVLHPAEGAFVRVKATLTPTGWKVFAAGARFGTQEVQLCLPEPGPGTKPAFPLTCYV